jgi:hypothetical protein
VQCRETIRGVTDKCLTTTLSLLLSTGGLGGEVKLPLASCQPQRRGHRIQCLTPYRVAPTQASPLGWEGPDIAVSSFSAVKQLHFSNDSTPHQDTVQDHSLLIKLVSTEQT